MSSPGEHALSGGGDPTLTSEAETKKKKTPRAKVRKHLITTAYKNDVVEKLDKLSAAGHTILSITASTDIRGWDIISYSEE